MRVGQVHSSETNHQFNSTLSPQKHTRSTIDSMSSYLEGATTPCVAKRRTPLEVICDMIECIKYFIRTKVQGCFESIMACLFKRSASSTREEEINIENLDDLLSSDSSSTDSLGAHEAHRHEEMQREDALYQTLPITDDDREKIRFIVHTLATANPFFMPTSELRQKGLEVSHVHPLRFLECIIMTPDLIDDIKIVKQRSFGIIWGQFTEELSEKFIRINESGMLLTHLNAFCRITRSDPRKIRECILRGQFKLMTELLTTETEQPFATPIPAAARQAPARRSSAARMSARASGPISPSPHVAALSSSLRSQAGCSLRESATTPAQPHARSTFSLAHLAMSDVHKQKLRRILTDVASNSAVSLLFQISSIRDDWKALKKVHPLRLLLEVFSDDAYVALLGQILSSGLKKPHFLTDFALTLQNGMSAEERIPYIEEFSDLMGASATEINMNIIVGGEYNWKNVIRYIYEIKQISMSNLESGDV